MGRIKAPVPLAGYVHSTGQIQLHRALFSFLPNEKTPCIFLVLNDEIAHELTCSITIAGRTLQDHHHQACSNQPKVLSYGKNKKKAMFVIFDDLIE